MTTVFGLDTVGNPLAVDDKVHISRQVILIVIEHAGSD